MGLQVTELTQGKQSWEKEFIDFKFDDKYISEFGMVAVADGGRHSFGAAPTFDNETSSVNGVDGQYFWGTHIGSLKKTYYLATDGMTEAQVNAFKLHFKPGKYGVFIEDKLAHRYGYARVSSVTTFSMVPFQKEVTIKGTTIKINEYKGDCRVTFEWDYPYMKSTENYIENWEANADEYLRAVYANGTPLSTSWDGADGTECYIGDESVALKKGGTTNISDVDDDLIKYYNPSTATTDCIIKMQFAHKFTDSNTWPVYHASIADSINGAGGKKDYNIICSTESMNTKATPTYDDDYKKFFYYSNPDVIYSVNRAIQIAASFAESNEKVLLELEEALRLEIVNPAVMGWAASVLRIMQMPNKGLYDSSGNFTENTITVDASAILGSEASSKSVNWFQYFNIYMLMFFATPTALENYHIDNADGIQGEWSFSDFIITFDGINCRSYITYDYNQIISETALTKIPVTEESCGDMIYSGYLTLDGGDTLTEDANISTCHYLNFMQGDNTMIPHLLALEYEYTYL